MNVLEPHNKSYIQLEYEYALEKEKPFFAVVIDENYLKERVKVRGIDVCEFTYQQQLKDFRKTVLTKLVRFWCDRKDIELAVLRTLSDFARRDDLEGWVPGNEAVNTGALAEEIARLAKENASLREQISKLGVASPFFSGTVQILKQRAASDENPQVREMAVRQLKVRYHRDV